MIAIAAGQRRLWLAIALLALALAAIIGWQYRLTFDASVARQREAGLAAQRLVEQQHRDTLKLRAQTIAGSQAFVGYVAQALGGALPGVPVDTTSILDLLEERRDQLGLGDAAVLDGQGVGIVSTRAFAAGRDLSVDPLVLRAIEQQAFVAGLWRDDSRLLHVGILPLSEDGSSEGYLVVALPVDGALAREIAGVSGLGVATVGLLADGARVFGSSLPAAPERELSIALRAAGVEADRVDVSGTAFEVAATPLLGAPDARWLMLASVDAARRAALPQLLPTVLVAFALWALCVVLALRWRSQVVAPAQALLALFDRASGGDMHLHAVPHGAAPLATLAAAFNVMLQGLRRPMPGDAVRAENANQPPTWRAWDPPAN
ncbi:hypothetical protein [Cognatilysobacter tabacisoli]|uniref:hypothetical protein n=1 Tax=Cognatilysobacter tabacisoli TaxID=2315424 RepID=UPI000E6AEF89|nr:hypothetical protein [Lysobacter tabacisoli]